MKQKLTLFFLALLTTAGMWARTALEYTALTTGVDYVLMDNGQQYFLANEGKTNSISAANRYQIVDAGDGKYYLMQTSTSQYVAKESNDATVTWTSDQGNAEKFTIDKQNDNTRVRFVSTTNTSYFLNSQGNNTNCPLWRNGTGDWSYWIVYAYSDFFAPVSNKGYKLKMKGTDLYVKFRISGYTETNAVNATSLESSGSIFKVESSGLTNTLKWQNEYVKSAGSYGWNSGHGTDASNSTWYIEPVSGEANTYYIRRTSDSRYFGNDVATPAAGNYIYTDQTSDKRNIKWVLEETTNVARMQENGFGPETSTAGSPKYYTIKSAHCNKYAKYAGDDAKMNLVSDRLGSTANSFWFEAVAVDGLPDDVLAVKIHNEAADKCVTATNSFTNDGITWYIKPEVYSPLTVAINSSSSEWNNNSYGWNNESGAGNYIAPYSSTDGGSVWCIEELSSTDHTTLSTNYSSNVTSYIQPFVDNPGTDYFKLASGKTSYLSAMISAFNGDSFVTHEEYNELNSWLNSNVNLPATGYYRIKSSGTRSIGESYIGYGVPDYYGTGLLTVAAANKLTDVSTVIRLTGSAGTYKISTQGLNVQSQTAGNTSFPATAETGVDFIFGLTTTPGVVTICNPASVNSDKHGYLHEGSSGSTKLGVINWQASSDQSKWTVEIAESVTVTLHGDDPTTPTNYYATFCAPFSYTVGSGAKAYTLAKSGNYLVPSEVDGTVTAGTPVLLKGSSETATLTIGSGYAATPLTTTDLTGTYVDMSVAKTAGVSNNYYLGLDGTTVGFYKWDGTTLKANRAYLDQSTAEAAVKGYILMFDDEPDAIKTLSDSPLKGENIYNLAGQRVSKMQKGINIVNGKKIMVK